MNMQKILIVLTVLNLALLTFLISRPGTAAVQDVAPVLRGRALEIVDDKGKVRASITIFPADPDVKMPDGTKGYPESVLLRLIDSKGQPNVKIQATNLGGIVGLNGEEDPTYVTLSAQGEVPSLKFRNGEGREQIIRINNKD